MVISLILNIILLVAFIYAAVKQNDRIKMQRRKKTAKAVKLSQLIDYFSCQVEKADDLFDLYVLHIKIWANGIRNENIGPNEFGIFRTKDILLMNPSEVYLGNIYGLWTFPLTKWNKEDKENYQIVLNQYKTILLSNMKEIKANL